MSKNTRSRILLTAVAALLLVVVSVAGTVAYLQANTDPIVNTFATSGISIDLKEQEYDPDTHLLVGAMKSNFTNDDYRFIPNVNLPKNPKVTATADVPFWVFVKVDLKGWDTVAALKDDNGNELIDWDLNFDGWSSFAAENATVYYKAFGAGDEVDHDILVGNQITVGDLTKEQLETLKGVDISMTFTAYACQQDTFAANGDKTAAQVAWETIW